MPTEIVSQLPFKVPPAVDEILAACPGFTIARDVKHLVEMSIDGADQFGWKTIAYDIGADEPAVEARVCQTRNGLAANYVDPYMRRRDPDCMVIGDDQPTNKKRFADRFGKDFSSVRQETFDWLAKQELVVFPFFAGAPEHGLPAVVLAPANAGFFAVGLALLQGILTPDDMPEDFEAKAVIYVAPPFRHTHFDGKQLVVHNRLDDVHELFSYNLYPGPSAKKGVYGMLLTLGEKEGWITAHCSTAQVVTPYDNIVTFMHEGASGGGKSEMLEHAHREVDGRLLLGRNVVDGEERFLSLPRACEIRPVTDDMALCPRDLQNDSGKLVVMDAEDAWFVRVNHITDYGTDPHLERLVTQPPEPLLFLNIDAVPHATTLIWEHVMDSPGVPCPNPRVVLPRHIVPKVVADPVAVDIRSFGVRTPPCTREKPTYGIIGMLQILPPALAWLWRLVAPRGHGNPSIVDTTGGLTSEGVGSYWPFATGRRVDQANLLLEQIQNTTKTLFILLPNQHIGSWQTGFMPQWIVREYLARRGTAKFRPEQITEARCPLLGWVPKQLVVEGSMIPPVLLRVETQLQVGPEAYDEGAKQLRAFFEQQLSKFLEDDLMPLGREAIKCCLDGGTVQQMADILPGK
ncbi:MAG: DUF4914 family protein [Phycisphaera sp.]|nr:DUF4914 family protein [Phycisphaera sp.]